MFERGGQAQQSPRRVARRGDCCTLAAGRAGGTRRRGGVVASETSPAYTTQPDACSAAAPADAAASSAGPRAPAAEPVGCVEEPRSAGARGRAAVAHLTEGPLPTPLGAAVGQLADAVEALAAVDLGDEAVDDVGAALLALQHLGARLDAALLDVIGAFDRRGGCRADGAVSTSAWLHWRSNTGIGAIHALVNASRRLADLPRVAGLLAAGDTTLAHVLAITRAATPQRADAVAAAEQPLAELAATHTPQDLRRVLRRLAELADPDGSDPPDPNAPIPPGDADRELRLNRTFEGRGDLTATLDPLTREALLTVLDAFRTFDAPDTPAGKRRSFAQRQHDAFAAALHTLLAHPGLPTVQGARPQILITIDLASLLGLPADHPAAGHTLADVAALLGINLDDLADHTDAPDADPDPDDADDPDGDAGQGQDADAAAGHEGAGRPGRPRAARYGSGVPVHADLVRDLLPTATIMGVLTLGPWRVVNVGRKQRTLPAWLRAVLTSLHRHCRGPNCDQPATWTQAHHIHAWGAGHDTDLNASLPLCRKHHDMITTKGWTAQLNHHTGEVNWTSPTGHAITVPPPH